MTHHFGSPAQLPCKNITLTVSDGPTTRWAYHDYRAFHKCEKIYFSSDHFLLQCQFQYPRVTGLLVNEWRSDSGSGGRAAFSPRIFSSTESSTASRSPPNQLPSRGEEGVIGLIIFIKSTFWNFSSWMICWFLWWISSSTTKPFSISWTLAPLRSGKEDISCRNKISSRARSLPK